MSQTTTIEERVAFLEKEMAELKRRVRPVETMDEWLRHVSGRLASYPEFDEVLRLGREIRQADRPDPDA